MSGNQSDGELYKLAVSGDRSAVETLVERHHADLVLYIKAKTNAHAVAEDAVAETWLRFFRHLKEAAEDPGRALDKPESIRFWLYRTAVNAMRDQFRTSSRQTALSDRVTGEARVRGETSYQPDELAGIEGAERRSLVREAFAKLTESCRELLSLMSADPPLSYQQIAEVLDRPIGSLGPTRQRCLADLRNHLGVIP
ncbi:MAG: RNA polymerase sigma factor [Actinomycetota bacterium]